MSGHKVDMDLVMKLLERRSIFYPKDTNKNSKNSYYKVLYSTNMDKHYLNNKTDMVAREGKGPPKGLTQGLNKGIYNKRSDAYTRHPKTLQCRLGQHLPQRHKGQHPQQAQQHEGRHSQGGSC